MALTIKRAFRSAVLAGSVLVSCSVHAFSLEGTLWATAQSKVDPYLLYAIALAESKKASDGEVRPWPWAVNVGGKAFYFSDLHSAQAFVDDQINRGVTNMDIGPMQINLYWQSSRIGDPKDLFHLPTAIRISADILSEALASSPNDQVLAVGRYHTWEDEQRARAYGTKVLTYRNMLNQLGR